MPGWKTWGSETLQAADINDKLMGQAVPRFANTTARDAGITSPDEGQMSFTDTEGLQIYQSTSIASAQHIKLWTPWADFSSPTWSSGVTVGDGTWNSAVRRFEGGSLHIRVQFTLGSTSAITSAPQFDLSGSVLSSVATDISMGKAVLRDTGSSQWYSATAIVGIGFDYVLIQADGGSNINSTTPFTWASGDIIAFDLVVTGPGTDAT